MQVENSSPFNTVSRQPFPQQPKHPAQDTLPNHTGESTNLSFIASKCPEDVLLESLYTNKQLLMPDYELIPPQTSNHSPDKQKRLDKIKQSILDTFKESSTQDVLILRRKNEVLTELSKFSLPIDLPPTNGAQQQCIRDLLSQEVEIRIPGIIPNDSSADVSIKFSFIECFQYLMKKFAEDPSGSLHIQDIQLIGKGALSVLPGLAESLIQTLLDDPKYTLDSSLTQRFEGRLNIPCFRWKIPFKSVESYKTCHKILISFIAKKVRSQYPESLSDNLDALIRKCLHVDISSVTHQHCAAKFSIFDIDPSDPKNRKVVCELIFSQRIGQTSPFGTSELVVSLKDIIEHFDASHPIQSLPSLIRCNKEEKDEPFDIKPFITYIQTTNPVTPVSSSLYNPLYTCLNKLNYSLDTTSEVWQACIDRLTDCKRLKEPLIPLCKFNGWLSLILAYLQGERPVNAHLEKQLIDDSFESLSGKYVLPEEILDILSSSSSDNLSAWMKMTVYFLKKLANNNYNLSIALLLQFSIVLQRNGYSRHIAPLWSALDADLIKIKPKAVDDEPPSIWDLFHQQMQQSSEGFETLLAILEVHACVALSKKSESEKSITTDLLMCAGKLAFKMSDGLYNIWLPTDPQKAFENLSTLTTTESTDILEKISQLSSPNRFEAKDSASLAHYQALLNIDYPSRIACLKEILLNTKIPYWKQLAAEGLLACISADKANASWDLTKTLLNEVPNSIFNKEEKQRFICTTIENFLSNQQGDRFHNFFSNAIPEIRGALLYLENTQPGDPEGNIYAAFQLWQSFHNQNQERKVSLAELDFLRKTSAYRPNLAISMLHQLEISGCLDFKANGLEIQKCLSKVCKNLKLKAEPVTKEIQQACSSTIALFQRFLPNSFLEAVTDCSPNSELKDLAKELKDLAKWWCTYLPVDSMTFAHEIMLKMLTEKDLQQAESFLETYFLSLSTPKSDLQKLSDFLIKLAATSYPATYNSTNDSQTPPFIFDKCLLKALAQDAAKATQLANLLANTLPLAPQSKTNNSPSIQCLKRLLSLSESIQNEFSTLQVRQAWKSFDESFIKAVISHAANNHCLLLSTCDLALSVNLPIQASKALLAASKIKMNESEKQGLKNSVFSLINMLQRDHIDKQNLSKAIKETLSSHPIETLLLQYPKDCFDYFISLHPSITTQKPLPSHAEKILRISLKLIKQFKASQTDYQACLPLIYECLKNDISKKSPLYIPLHECKKQLLNAIDNESSVNSKNLRNFFNEGKSLSNVKSRASTITPSEVATTKVAISMLKQPPVPSVKSLEDTIQELTLALNKPDLQAAFEALIQGTQDANIQNARLTALQQQLEKIDFIAHSEAFSQALVDFFSTLLQNYDSSKPSTTFKVAVTMWIAVKASLLKALKSIDINAFLNTSHEKPIRIISPASIPHIEKYLETFQMYLMGCLQHPSEFTTSLNMYTQQFTGESLENLKKIFTPEMLLLSTFLPKNTLQHYYKAIIPLYMQAIHADMTNKKIIDFASLKNLAALLGKTVNNASSDSLFASLIAYLPKTSESVENIKYLEVFQMHLMGLLQSPSEFTDTLKKCTKRFSKESLENLKKFFPSEILLWARSLSKENLEPYCKAIIPLYMQAIQVDMTNKKIIDFASLENLAVLLGQTVNNSSPYKLLASLIAYLPDRQALKLCEAFHDLKTSTSLNCSLMIAQKLLNNPNLNEKSIRLITKVLNTAIDEFPSATCKFCKTCLIHRSKYLSNETRFTMWEKLLNNIITPSATQAIGSSEALCTAQKLFDLIIKGAQINDASPAGWKRDNKFVLASLAYLCVFENSFPAIKIKDALEFLQLHAKHLKCTEEHLQIEICVNLLKTVAKTICLNSQHLEALFIAIERVINLLPPKLPSDHYQIALDSLLNLSLRNIFDSCFSNIQNEKERAKEYNQLNARTVRIIQEITSKNDAVPILFCLLFSLSGPEMDNQSKILRQQIKNYASDVLKLYRSALKIDRKSAGYVHTKRLYTLLKNASHQKVFTGNYQEYLSAVEILMCVAVDYAKDEDLFPEMAHGITKLLFLKCEKSKEEMNSYKDTVLKWIHSLETIDSVCAAEAERNILLRAFETGIFSNKDPDIPVSVYKLCYKTEREKPQTQEERNLISSELFPYLKNDLDNDQDVKQNYCYHFVRTHAIIKNALEDGFFQNNYKTFMDMIELLMGVAIDSIHRPRIFKLMTERIASLMCSPCNREDEIDRCALILHWCKRLKTIEGHPAETALSHTFKLAKDQGYLNLDQLYSEV